MWSGKTSTRRVNISGTSRKTKRGDVLRQAKAAREQRASKRRRLTSSLTIQSSWRAASSLRKLRAECQAGWDKKMHDLHNLEIALRASGIDFIPPTATICKLLREFLFFFSLKSNADLQRLLNVCHMLQRSLMSNSVSHNYFAMVNESTSVSLWLFQMKNFFCIALSSTYNIIQEHTVDNIFNKVFALEVSVAVLHLLQMVLDCHTWYNKLFPKGSSQEMMKCQKNSWKLLLGKVENCIEEKTLFKTNINLLKEPPIAVILFFLRSLLYRPDVPNSKSDTISSDDNSRTLTLIDKLSNTSINILCNICQGALLSSTYAAADGTVNKVFKQVLYRARCLFGRLIMSSPGLLFSHNKESSKEHIHNDKSNKEHIHNDTSIVVRTRSATRSMVVVFTESSCNVWHDILEGCLLSLHDLKIQSSTVRSLDSLRYRHSSNDISRVDVAWMASNILLLCQMPNNNSIFLQNRITVIESDSTYTDAKLCYSSIGKHNTSALNMCDARGITTRALLSLRILVKSIPYIPLKAFLLTGSNVSHQTHNASKDLSKAQNSIHEGKTDEYNSNNMQIDSDDEEEYLGEEGLAKIEICDHKSSIENVTKWEQYTMKPLIKCAMNVLLQPNFIRSIFEGAISGISNIKECIELKNEINNPMIVDECNENEHNECNESKHNSNSCFNVLIIATELYRLLFDYSKDSDKKYNFSRTSNNSSQFFNMLQSGSNGINISVVLNTLAFAPPPKIPYCAMMWRILVTRVNIMTFAKEGSFLLIKPEMTEDLHSIRELLYVSLIAFSQLLSALDDEDFYIKQFPFRLDELRYMVIFLRELLYRLYWTGKNCHAVSDAMNVGTSHSVSRLSTKDFNTLRLCTRLFNQLYNRDCRRKFCNVDDWLWPNLPVSDCSALDLTRGVMTRGSVVLSTIPQVISFKRRASFFYEILKEDRSHHQSQHGLGNRVTIRRNYLFEDSFRAFNSLLHNVSASESVIPRDSTTNGTRRLKQRMQITYVDEHDNIEPGIDGGGIFKDFMDALTRRAFDPRYALFKSTSQNYLYPNADSATSAGIDHLNQFEFLGQVLGKSLYEGILVEPKLARFFLNKVLGKNNLIDELQSLDPMLYRNLMFLKKYKDGPVEDLCLHFSVAANQLGENRVIPLIPNGNDVKVNEKNRIKYIVLMANHKLNVEIGPQCAAFLKGLRSLIPLKWLRMFSSVDLQRLIGGTDTGLDVNDLQMHTRLTGGYDRSLRSGQVNGSWFFNILRDFTPDEHSKLLKFVTSCSRPPLLGFSHLNPPFTIQRVNIREDNERLPTASTCMNLLKLPTYSSQAVMKSKLLFVISCDAGFELS